MDLAGLLRATLSPDRNEARSSEKSLKALEEDPDFALKLLQLLESSTVDPITLQAGAVYFKNLVRTRWADLPETSANTVKQHIVSLMCLTSTNKAVNAQLSESVRLIAEADFPDKWPTLLSDLNSKLNEPIDTVLGVLETFNSIFKRFRDAPTSDDLWLVLKYCLEEVQAQILALFKHVHSLAVASVSSKTQDRPKLLAALRLINRIFYSLNWQVIPEYFEDHRHEWFGGFLEFLSIPLAQGTLDLSEEDEPTAFESLLESILSNVDLYATKYGEEFEPFLRSFVQASFSLLVTPHAIIAQKKCDGLVSKTMTFLTSVMSRSYNRSLFEAANTLGNVMEKIVLPNVYVRESDVENFHENSVDYIRVDVEGSDADSRRKNACELLKAMTKTFPDETVSLCSRCVPGLLSQSDWRSKEAAIVIASAYLTTAQTAREGVTAVRSVSDVNSFFNATVLPLLSDTNAHPVLIATCLKFAASMRQFLEKTITDVFAAYCALLNSPHWVIRTYAASGIEKTLTICDANDRSLKKFSQVDVAPYLESILTSCFKAPEEENEYVMKCVLRVLSVSRSAVKPVVPSLLSRLKLILERVCKNPSNPKFNHFLFENIAALIQFSSPLDESSANALFETLNPSFELVLQQGVSEFMPYVFQIMAQMLEESPVVPNSYNVVLSVVLGSNEMWSDSGSVPALSRLLEAYLSKMGSNLEASKISAVLEIFSRLVRKKSTVDHSFLMLESLVTKLPLEMTKDALPSVLAEVLRIVHSSKSLKTATAFLVFLGLACGQHGPEAIASILNKVQPNLLDQIFVEMWIPYVENVRGDKRRAVAYGGARACLELRSLTQNHAAWILLVLTEIRLLSSVSTRADAAIADDLDALAEGGFQTSYARLAYASKTKKDYFPEAPRPLGNWFITQLIAKTPLKEHELKELVNSAPDSKHLTTVMRSFGAKW